MQKTTYFKNLCVTMINGKEAQSHKIERGKCSLLEGLEGGKGKDIIILF